MGLHAFDPTRVRAFGRQAEHPRLLDVVVETPPAEEPVTLAELKEWLRVDGTDQDSLITSLIVSARQWAEGYTSRSFVDRALDVTWARFPVVGADLYLPGPPATALTALTWIDSAGTAQAFDTTDTTLEALYGLLRVDPDAVENWPQDAFSVRALYTGGFGADAAAVPEPIKTAIKVAVTQNFLFRGDQIAGTQFSTAQLKSSMSLLNHFRMFRT